MGKILIVIGVCIASLSLLFAKGENPDDQKKSGKQTVPRELLRKKRIKTRPYCIDMTNEIYFEYESSYIRDDAATQLRQLKDCLDQAVNFKLMVIGHGDEREEEPIGVRRANSVRSYLVNLGADRSRISIQSKGKSSPACTQHNENCWAKNRRVEFLFR